LAVQPLIVQKESGLFYPGDATVDSLPCTISVVP